MAEEKGGKTARLVGLTALTSAFAHPLAYVKVLVQVLLSNFFEEFNEALL